MSFTRQNNDTGAYEQHLAESVGPGLYKLNEPAISCEPCYPWAPTVRLQRQGDSIDTSKNLIDIDSELLNITRKDSKCPSKKFLPKCEGGACDQLKTQKGFCKDTCNTNFKDCFFHQESTRLSNPTCTLRGTGFNRWQWLCKDPQNDVFAPFDTNVSTRLLARDNHRPCIPTPIDPIWVLPNANVPLQSEPTASVGAPTTYPPSQNWQKRCNVSQY
jgi:hypothetical protein